MRTLAIVPLLLVALATSALAAEPFARAHLDPAGPVTAGQPVELVAEVFVPTWFSGAPTFPALDIPNAVVVFTDRGVNLTKTIDGETWAGQMRSYLVYPQAAGTYDVPALEITVRYAIDAKPSAPTVARTEPLTIEVRVPEAAKDLEHFLATPHLTAEQSIEGDPDALAVGGAVTRTVTLRAEGAFAMMLPPLAFEAPDGVEVYPDRPRVADSGGERGETRVGERTEAATYVMHAAGAFELPAIEVRWGNTARDRVETTTLPSVALQVAEGAAPEGEIPLVELAEEAGARSDDAGRVDVAALVRRWGGWIAATVLLVVAAFRTWRRFGPRLVAALHDERERRLRSEARAYRRFREAARSGDAREAFRALMAWLDRTRDEDLPTLRGFVEDTADEALDRTATDLTDRLFAADPPGGPWSGAPLEHRVAAHRHDEREEAERSAAGLRPLNPRG